MFLKYKVRVIILLPKWRRKMSIMRILGLSILFSAGLSASALAYVGPGAGLGAIGAALGLIAAVVIALGAILFWPIRRLMRRGKAKLAQKSDAAASAETPESTRGS